jgi:hypothetical protein
VRLLVMRDVVAGEADLVPEGRELAEDRYTNS